MKILFSGGGTLGPVTPLLAIFEIYKQKDPTAKFTWIGTLKGPEKIITEKYGIPFYRVVSCKWRRYFSLWNIVDFFKLSVAFFQCLIILWVEKPDLLVSAGGFVSVPVHWAGALLGIPEWIHQQDMRVGLANKLNARFADKITTALRETVKFFPERKTEWIGNPVRDLRVQDLVGARQRLDLSPHGPVIFALGGGTGSANVNRLILEALPQWPKDWQILHLTGDRDAEAAEKAAETFTNYHPRRFFTSEMKDAYAVADLVIARAGFGTITELASLSKAAIIIPMSGTHQEENTKILSENKAAIIVNENSVNKFKLAHIVSEVINLPEMKHYLGCRLNAVLPSAKSEKILEIIGNLTK